MLKFSKPTLYLLLLLSSLLVLGVVSSVWSAPKAPIPAAKPTEAEYVSGQLLVQYTDGVSESAKERISGQVGISGTIRSFGPRNQKNIHLYQLKPGRSPVEVAARLKGNSRVVVASPNYIGKLSGTPDDPDFPRQWGLQNTGQIIDGVPGTPGADINAPQAWDIEQGFSNTVTVAVLDSGIDLNHPDLVDKLWVNPGEIPDNSTDDDLNGFIDDVNGYNFAGISFNATETSSPLGGLPYEMAQSIKGTGQPLTWAGIYASRVNTPTADLIISVRDDLNGNDLTAATITPSDVATDSPILGTPLLITTGFPQPVILAADETYYIVLKTTDTSQGAYYKIGDNLYKEPSEDGYKDGMAHWQVGGDWIGFPSRDLGFRTNPNAVPRDDNGHGTHVSGIVGAATNNSLGASGVAPGARIMPIKVSGAGGRIPLDQVINGIYYATDMGADVINLSIAFIDHFEPYGAEQLAIYYAVGNGVTVVAAAGKIDDLAKFNPEDKKMMYPAGYDYVIGVGATKNNDTMYELSFYHLTEPLVDFAAPGVGVYSTFPTYPVAQSSKGIGPDYGYMEGSSMSSAFVSGLAALILSREPSLNHIQVEKVLEKGVDDIGELGFDQKSGYGRINAYQSLSAMLLETSISVYSPVPDGDNGWYVTTPTISLEPSLTNATPFYAWDTTAAVTTYTVSLTPPAGVHTLYYYSATPSTTEIIKSREFKLDAIVPTDPTSVTSPSHTTGTVSANNVIKVDFSGAADTISGLDGYSVLWSQNTAQLPPAGVNLAGGSSVAYSSPLADGTWWFNLRTKDIAGHWTSTVHLGPFTVDKHVPTGSVKINSGAAKTKTKSVILNLSATDGSGTGVDKMRVKNWGGVWSSWEAFTTTKSWNLTSANGTKKVYVEFKDFAGNKSVTVSDSIFLDSKAPATKVTAPKISTFISRTTKFKVRWAGTDPTPSSGINRYDVQYKIYGGGWTGFRTNTTKKAGNFKGKPGKTYYFRAMARDNAGNVGKYSKARRTVVPYDNGQLIRKRAGFRSVYKKSGSKFYRGTIRYSPTPGAYIVYRFSGRSVKLISTKASNRSQAAIFLDGKYIRTIDAYSAKRKFRQVVFSARWKKKRTHNLKIVNLGTLGRNIFDVDALAVTK